MEWKGIARMNKQEKIEKFKREKEQESNGNRRREMERLKIRGKRKIGKRMEGKVRIGR